MCTVLSYFIFYGLLSEINLDDDDDDDDDNINQDCETGGLLSASGPQSHWILLAKGRDLT